MIVVNQQISKSIMSLNAIEMFDNSNKIDKL